VDSSGVAGRLPETAHKFGAAIIIRAMDVVKLVRNRFRRERRGMLPRRPTEVASGELAEHRGLHLAKRASIALAATIPFRCKFADTGAELVGRREVKLPGDAAIAHRRRREPQHEPSDLIENGRYRHPAAD
jgi:hypothetical protein